MAWETRILFMSIVDEIPRAAGGPQSWARCDQNRQYADLGQVS